MKMQAEDTAELGESDRCGKGSWVFENMSLSQWRRWWGQILSIPYHPQYCLPRHGQPYRDHSELALEGECAQAERWILGRTFGYYRNLIRGNG